MKLLSLIGAPLLLISVSALAQDVDPAPSGVETQVIVNDPSTGTNIGTPGADGTVRETITPGRQVIEFDPAGTEVSGTADDNTSIQYGD